MLNKGLIQRWCAQRIAAQVTDSESDIDVIIDLTHAIVLRETDAQRKKGRERARGDAILSLMRACMRHLNSHSLQLT